ncbi:hypothetical protein Cgig2_032799 [Carnegiea gigantea]|uniref:Uncharacterized protein n=1 Tax=Carnegiea gigantea TaxID=171969 RepID=A0A9Q1JXS5_9CARY|nr:hypothetical protein Cgig2_032799 [Carnegiea gigantea]
MGIPLVSRPFAQCQLRATRKWYPGFGYWVQQHCRVCHGILLTYSVDVEVSPETKSEIIIQEIRTEYGHKDLPVYGKYLVEELADYLILLDEASCRGSSKEDRLCLETEPVQGPDIPGHPLRSVRYLRDNYWINIRLPLTKFESNLEYLEEQIYQAEKPLNPDEPVVCVWPLTDRIHAYARLFIFHCFFRVIADRLQILSTDFIELDFVDACVGLTHVISPIRVPGSRFNYKIVKIVDTT